MLRSAQHDKRSAQHDKRSAQHDKRSAQHDKRSASPDEVSNLWDAVIIGGGITGLSAARKLETASRPKPIRYLLLESGPRLGGTIQTLHRDGFVIEKGPDAFLTERPWAVDLAKALGLEEEIIGTNPACRRSFVVRNGWLCPVPPGFYLIAPSEIRPFLASPILSFKGKIRLLAEPWIPVRKNPADESVASFVTRRMGREAYERIGQPMVGGIYTGDPSRLSAAKVLPKFVAMEREERSVLRGLLKNRFLQKQSVAASGPRYGLFVSFKSGMECLTQKLAGSLGNNAVRLQTSVKAVRYDFGEKSWFVSLSDGSFVKTRAVLGAVPAHQAAGWFAGGDAGLERALRAIAYESVVTVSYAFERSAVSHALNGFGFVVPAGEARTVIAGSFSSVKFAGRAPEGRVLLRVFAGGAFGRAALDLNDAEIAARAERELAALLGIRGQSLFCEVSRHRQAMPQYTLEHEGRVAAIRRSLAERPGLELTGSAYDGVGIPECVRQGEEAADKLISFLTNPMTTQGAAR